jgi:hypothetical protein
VVLGIDAQRTPACAARIKLALSVNTRRAFFVVAHSVNPFEDTFVTAVASEWDGVRQPITSLGWAQNRRALSPDIAFVLARLAAGVREVTKKRVAIEERSLLAVIQALPLDTIHDGDTSPRPIKDSDVSKSRKQKTRSRSPRKRRAAAK